MFNESQLSQEHQRQKSQINESVSHALHRTCAHSLHFRHCNQSSFGLDGVNFSPQNKHSASFLAGNISPKISSIGASVLSEEKLFFSSSLLVLSSVLCSEWENKLLATSAVVSFCGFCVFGLLSLSHITTFCHILKNY